MIASEALNDNELNERAERLAATMVDVGDGAFGALMDAMRLEVELYGDDAVNSAVTGALRLERWRRSGDTGGRPTGSDYPHPFAARFAEAQYAAMKAAADEEGVSVAEWIRRAVDDRLGVFEW